MITKKTLSESLSLSCVESYFLTWLAEYYDVKLLYGQSFLPIKKVFDDFSQGAIYQNYNEIERLQNLAQSYGIVKHDFCVCGSRSALEYIKQQDDSSLCLIRVNGNFFSSFKRVPWREDHYICVNKNLEWVNEYPLSQGKFTLETFKQCYDMALIVYKLGFLNVAPPMNVFEMMSGDNEFISNFPRDLQALESALGVLRVSRKRMEQYFSRNETLKVLFFKENILLDKLYLKVNLLRIRGKRMLDDVMGEELDFFDKIDSLLSIEALILEELKKNGTRID